MPCWNFFETSDLISHSFPSSATANQKTPFIFVWHSHANLHAGLHLEHAKKALAANCSHGYFLDFYILYKIPNLFMTGRGKSHFFLEFLEFKML